MHIDAFYTVVTDFGKLGFGNANDATTDRDQAYADFAEAVLDGQPARAFYLTFDVETSALESCTEVTGDFRDEFETEHPEAA